MASFSTPSNYILQNVISSFHTELFILIVHFLLCKVSSLASATPPLSFYSIQFINKNCFLPKV